MSAPTTAVEIDNQILGTKTTHVLACRRDQLLKRMEAVFADLHSVPGEETPRQWDPFFAPIDVCILWHPRRPVRVVIHSSFDLIVARKLIEQLCLRDGGPSENRRNGLDGAGQ